MTDQPNPGTPTPPEDHPLLDALLRVMRALRGQYDAAAGEVGLTFSRARVISALARAEGVTQAELAETLGIEPPTLKRQIDALERDGFLLRQGLAGDGRKRALVLTDKARAAKVARFMARVRDDLLAGVSEADQQQLQVVLERIAANAETRLAPPPGPKKPKAPQP